MTPADPRLNADGMKAYATLADELGRDIGHHPSARIGSRQGDILAPATNTA